MIVALILKLDYSLAYKLATKKDKKMQISYPLKIQAIRSRGQQPRLYVSFPLALAAAIARSAPLRRCSAMCL